MDKWEGLRKDIQQAIDFYSQPCWIGSVVEESYHYRLIAFQSTKIMMDKWDRMDDLSVDWPEVVPVEKANEGEE